MAACLVGGGDGVSVWGVGSWMGWVCVEATSIGWVESVIVQASTVWTESVIVLASIVWTESVIVLALIFWAESVIVLASTVATFW